MPHPWLPHPAVDPPRPALCPVAGPHFRTAALARAAIPDGAPSRDIPTRCHCGRYQLTEPNIRPEGTR
jgi:hypothetical protein